MAAKITTTSLLCTYRMTSADSLDFEGRAN